MKTVIVLFLVFVLIVNLDLFVTYTCIDLLGY
jgi:hypothetical protein